MGVRWFALLAFVLIASQIQCVHCPDLDSSQDHSSPVSDLKDNCGNATSDCIQAPSRDKILSWVTSTLSCIIFFVPFIRAFGLQSSDQDANAAQTLFRWSFFFGIQAYNLWIRYFFDFYQYTQCPGFPVLLTCFLGAFTNAGLLHLAISEAPVVNGVPRKVGVVLSLIVIVCAFFYKNKRVIGWAAVAFGVLCHSFRIASTDYYANLNGFLLGASVLGGVNRFLWLIHPQLCISFEYKVWSYIIGCLRGLEALLWLSRLVAPVLSKIEGRIFAPQPHQLEHELQPR